MSAVETSEKKAYTYSRNDVELTVVEPPSLLVKMLTEKEENKKKKKSQLLIENKQHLPTPPSGYIKFPKYDWF